MYIISLKHCMIFDISTVLSADILAWLDNNWNYLC